MQRIETGRKPLLWDDVNCVCLPGNATVCERHTERIEPGNGPIASVDRLRLAVVAQVAADPCHFPKLNQVFPRHSGNCRIANDELYVGRQVDPLGPCLDFPLLVGTVETVGMRENNLVKFATVRPAVNFTRLDFVQVVLTAPDEGTGVNNP